MADFRTHVSTSSVLGIGYAGMGVAGGIELESALVGGGLCGVSGMLPDLDSDSGIPIREATGFAAGIVPMLLVDRFRTFDVGYDRMVLITAILYFVIRFAGSNLLGRFTVHRGMFHSIPAGLIFAGLAFLICGPEGDYQVRYFKAGAVFFGFMSHLFLDELYSLDFGKGGVRLKRSFGTAIKLWGKNGWANFSTYAKLVIVAVLVAGEPSVMSHLEERYPEFAQRVQRLHETKAEIANRVRDRASSGSGAEPQPPVATQQQLPAVYPPPEVAEPWPSQPSGGFQNQPLQPAPNQWPNQTPNAWPSQPAAPLGQPQAPQLPAEESFSPNAGQPFGTAQPFYRASDSFAPR